MNGRADGGRAGRRGEQTPRMRELHALTDGALVCAMRSGDPAAFQAFRERFAPLLEAYAYIMRIPTADWAECIEDVLTDAAIRWTEPTVQVPRQMAAYLKAMVRNSYLRKRRTADLESKIVALAESEGTEPMLRALYGESTVHAALGFADEAEVCTVRALRGLAVLLRDSLNDEEQLVIGWIALRVPYRKIAELIGSGYEATSKRIQRLQRRLRDVAIAKHLRFAPDEQREIDRFLRRVMGLQVLRRQSTEHTQRVRARRRQRVSEADRAPDGGSIEPDAYGVDPTADVEGSGRWTDSDDDPGNQ